MTLNQQHETLKMYNERTIPTNAGKRSEKLLRKNILKELENQKFNNARPRYKSLFSLSKGTTVSLTEKKMLKQMGARGGILH